MQRNTKATDKVETHFFPTTYRRSPELIDRVEEMDGRTVFYARSEVSGPAESEAKFLVFTDQGEA